MTLHVGIGTFRPVAEENIEDHEMHREWYTIEKETAQKVNEAKEEGRRIIAVGTTSVRTLESAGQTGRVEAGSSWTQLYIYPGYQWQVVDAIVTNFHLPESTLIMMMASLLGENIFWLLMKKLSAKSTGSFLLEMPCFCAKRFKWLSIMS